MKPEPKKPSRKPGADKAKNALVLGKEIATEVFCIGFAHADKGTPPWAKVLIKTSLGYLSVCSRSRGKEFAQKLPDSVALVRAVKKAVRKHLKPVHRKKAAAAFKELAGKPNGRKHHDGK